MKKILVAVDGSPTSMKAAKVAVEVAKKFYSSIIFLSVVKTPDLLEKGRISVNNAYSLSSVMEELSHQHKIALDECVSELSGLSKLSYEKLVVVGEPYERIVGIAQEKDADLIVIGRRGFSQLKRFLLGSVSQRVVAHAKCPVLVVNEEVED